MSDKGKNKNNKIFGLVLVVLAFILIISGIVLSINNKNNSNNNVESDQNKFKLEYEELNGKMSSDEKEYLKVNIPSNNKIKYSTVDEILDIFSNKGNAVIYFGYPSCLYCRSAVEVLADTAKGTELKEIYYLDTEENSDDYSELLNILGEEFIDTDDGEKIYSPLVIFVVDGQIVSYNKGTIFSQDDPYVELDDYQKQGLSEIYSNGINDVIFNIELKKRNSDTE